MNVLPLIEKIHLLESRLGAKWKHSIMEPFAFDSSNPIKVQEVGKKIAQHIGLPQLTFIISYSEQQEGAAGHINLDQSEDVFIEIDSNYREDYEMVLYILAHEICHKYLQINNIHLFPVFENEVLTDTATFYTGLGKLVLNGCLKLNQVSNYTEYYTELKKIGYLDIKQFAFIYSLICKIRRIPEKEVLEGLNYTAQIAINDVKIEFSYYLDDSLFQNESTLKLINDSVKSEIQDAQTRMAKLNRDLRVLQEDVLPIANQYLKDFHLHTKAKIADLKASVDKSFKEEPHNYLKNLLVISELEKGKKRIIEKEKELRKFAKGIPKFLDFVYRSSPKYFSKDNTGFLRKFQCPSCSTNMKIKETKLARVNCAKCDYTFIVDTRFETLVKEKEQGSQTSTKEKGFWGKFFPFGGG